MTPQELMALAKSIGDRLAQRVFDRRSKQRQNVEVHLGREELAGLCALAAELALKSTLPAEEQAKLPKVIESATDNEVCSYCEAQGYHKDSCTNPRRST